MKRDRIVNDISIGIAVLLAVSFVSLSAFAQEGVDDIEGLFNKDEAQQNSVDVKVRPDETAKAPVAPGQEIKGVSDLGKLSDFDDVAVIQKRYLPKTGRFEAYVAPTVVLNDAFFLNYGLNARINYSFSERYALEIPIFYLTTSPRGVTEGLYTRGITTTSFVTPKSYYGLDFRWTPVYGKMGSPSGKITPFDLYFALGGGLTSTTEGSNEPTAHFATGQIFARTKGTAFRWDFSWNVFSAQPNLTTSRSIYNTLFISVGMSFLFPEATYR